MLPTIPAMHEPVSTLVEIDNEPTQAALNANQGNIHKNNTMNQTTHTFTCYMCQYVATVFDDSHLYVDLICMGDGRFI